MMMKKTTAAAAAETVVDTDGIGGFPRSFTDCVPSKTLIATAELMADMEEANELRHHLRGLAGHRPRPGQRAR